jgi:hypothetical protein
VVAHGGLLRHALHLGEAHVGRGGPWGVVTADSAPRLRVSAPALDAGLPRCRQLTPTIWGVLLLHQAARVVSSWAGLPRLCPV